ncbi:MAG TPA: histidine kinase [Myxococcaceae bacterium]|nr:histidine kinase [Myxococcaceae bacterium]
MSRAPTSWSRRARGPLLVLAAANLVALELTAFSFLSDTRPPGVHFLDILQRYLLAVWLWAGMVPVVGHLARRYRLDAPPRLRNASIHLAAALGIIVLVMASYTLVGFYQLELYSQPTWWAALRSAAPHYIPFDLTVYAFILLGWTAHDWYDRYRERDLRAAQLEASLQEAKLAALRSQLNPHFLFNALNSVSALMHRDVDAADAMLARIGELLRLTLASDGAHEIRLHEELELLERYLDVERIRFAERLAVTVDVPPATLAARLPPFSLQPLVENAIHHGVARNDRGGQVTISARQVDGRLQLRVLDNGPGLRAARPREGVGLRNTRDRLRQLYGDAQQLELRSPSSGGLEVTVELPWRT